MRVNLGRALVIVVVVSLLGLASCGGASTEPKTPVTGGRAQCTMVSSSPSDELKFIVRCGKETQLGTTWCAEGCSASLNVEYYAHRAHGSGQSGTISAYGRCMPREDATECFFPKDTATRTFESERKKLQAEYDRFMWTSISERPDVKICVGAEPGANFLPRHFVYAKADDGEALRVIDVIKSMEKGTSPVPTAAKSEETDPDIPDGPAKELGKQEIAILVDALPLSRDAIRFQALDKFILLYAPFTENKALLRRARNAFRNARRSLTAEMASISTSASLNELASIVKRPTPEEERKGLSHASYAFALVSFTMDGLSLTRAIIGDFYEKVRDAKRLTNEQEERVLGQIGMGPGSSSIYGANFYRFQELKRLIEKDAGIKN